VSFVKRLVLSALTTPLITRPLRAVTAGTATVFMLHRFRQTESGSLGYPVPVLRRVLDRLRRDRYHFLDLEALAQGLARGEVPREAVVFTIDDGYLDQAELGAPAFAEFDCPVTTFVTTGFLDRQLWFWWDRIEFVFQQTRRAALGVDLNGQRLAWTLDSPVARAAAQEDFTVRCKSVPDAEKHSAIARLAADAEVELPVAAPPAYAPMSWEQARRCEGGGMRFGPHTVTHPILSRTTDAVVAEELAGSWTRLQAEVRRPMPVYCYPNGGPEDFGAREISILSRLGLLGAVVGDPGYATPARFRAGPEGPFRILRFDLPESLPHVVQCTARIEHLKTLVLRKGA